MTVLTSCAYDCDELDVSNISYVPHNTPRSLAVDFRFVGPQAEALASRKDRTTVITMAKKRRASLYSPGIKHGNC